MRRNLKSSNPIEESHYHDSQYLAWENVRKKRNPFFENGTGFEGYFVGICLSPEEVLEKILIINKDILNNLVRLYRFDYSFQSRLFKALTEDRADTKAMHDWAAEFGAALAKLRMNVHEVHNPTADYFRSETYRIVKALPPIRYSEVEYQIGQHYVVGFYNGQHNHQLVIMPSMLKPNDQDPWLVAQLIGKFGHPLVREYLRCCVN